MRYNGRGPARRMKRRLLNFLTAVSLLLCVAVCGLWARSYWASDGTTSEDGLDTFIMHKGQIVWKHRSAEGADYITATGRTNGFKLLGVGAVKTQTAGGEHLWTFGIPLWFLTLITGIVPALRLPRFRNRRLTDWRRGQQRCESCGYDLRATPGRCPECGTLGHKSEPPNSSAVTSPR